MDSQTTFQYIAEFATLPNVRCERTIYYCTHCKIHTQPDQKVRDNERCIICGFKMEKRK